MPDDEQQPDQSADPGVSETPAEWFGTIKVDKGKGAYNQQPGNQEFRENRQ